MKAIFKIIEYLPDTKQIVVRFARYNAPEPIDKYRKVAINYSQLDFQDMESFTKSLMRTCGDDRVRNQENNDRITERTKRGNTKQEVQRTRNKIKMNIEIKNIVKK